MQKKHGVLVAFIAAAALGLSPFRASAVIVYQSHELDLFGNAMTTPPDTRGYGTHFSGPGNWNWTDLVSVQHQYENAPAPATAFSQGELRSSANADFLHVFFQGAIENHPIGGIAGSDTSHNAVEDIVLTVDTAFSARTWGAVSSLFVRQLETPDPAGFGLSGDQTISGILPAGHYTIIGWIQFGTFADSDLVTSGFEYSIPSPASASALALMALARFRRQRRR